MTYLDELFALYSHKKQQLCQIKLVAFDVDGVLTNGQLHYTAKGESTKVFNVRDGVGLKLLTDVGVHVAVVTAKDSEMVAQRITDLGVTNYFPGAKNKLQVIEELAQKNGLTLEECCFVGDDMVDLLPMKNAGIGFCPADAYALVKENADIVLPLAGGQGIARMVADIILASQGRFAEAYHLTTSAEFERKRS